MVPVDFVLGVEKVLTAAITLAQAFSARIDLVHFEISHKSAEGYQSEKSRQKKMMGLLHKKAVRESARSMKKLESIMSILVPKNVQGKSLAADPTLPGSLVEVNEAIQPDLIMLEPNHEHRLIDLFSINIHQINLSSFNAPVMIVSDRLNSVPSTVILATDLTSTFPLGLLKFCEELQQLGAELHIANLVTATTTGDIETALPTDKHENHEHEVQVLEKDGCAIPIGQMISEVAPDLILIKEQKDYVTQKMLRNKHITKTISDLNISVMIDANAHTSRHVAVNS